MPSGDIGEVGYAPAHPATPQSEGTIVTVMAANPMAFRAHARNRPFDGEHMNRLLPRNPTGAHSPQAAAVLTETAREVAGAMTPLVRHRL